MTKSLLSMTSAELEADQHKRGRKPTSDLRKTSHQLESDQKKTMAKKMKTSGWGKSGGVKMYVPDHKDDRKAEGKKDVFKENWKRDQNKRTEALRKAGFFNK